MPTVTQVDKSLLLRRVVDAAVLAPSAENVQPWRFRKDGERLTVYFDRRLGFGGRLFCGASPGEMKGLHPQVFIGTNTRIRNK